MRSLSTAEIKLLRKQRNTYSGMKADLSSHSFGMDEQAKKRVSTQLEQMIKAMDKILRKANRSEFARETLK